MIRQITRRRLITAGAGAAALGALPQFAWSQTAASASGDKVRMVTGLRAASQCITWIGTEAGVFRKHGLEVSFPKLEVGGPESAAGLMRGDWDFAQTGTVPIAEEVLKGGDVVILLRNTAPHVGIVIMTRRELTSLDQLAGKRVGVLTDAYSGQSGVVTRLAVEKAGVTANYVGLGTYQNIYAVLGAGEIDAGALPIDFRFLGQRQYGWNTFDTAAFGVPSIFSTTRRMIASNRDRVVRAVRGFVETIHLFKTQPDVVVPLLQRFLNFSDRKAVEDLRGFYAPLFPAVPRPSLSGGMQEIRDLFLKRYPAVQRLQESDIADSSIIDEVERSGFIERLYAGAKKS